MTPAADRHLSKFPPPPRETTESVKAALRKRLKAGPETIPTEELEDFGSMLVFD